MGMHASAILAYGYNLGGEEEWALHDLGKYGALPALDWYNPDEDDDGEGFAGAAERRLLAEIAGFTEEYDPEDGAGYFDRARAARNRLGVKLDTYCSGDYPQLLLATKTITVYQGSVQTLDPAELAATPPEWDTRLRAALDTLGLNPTQDAAQWLLCSYMG